MGSRDIVDDLLAALERQRGEIEFLRRRVVELEAELAAGAARQQATGGTLLQGRTEDGPQAARSALGP